MLYAILCYSNEDVVGAWSSDEDQAVMERLAKVQDRAAEKGKLGPVVRLLPTTTATTLRKQRQEPLIVDGPFAETKEQLLGFYTIDCDSLAEAHAFAQELVTANPAPGCYEIRPVGLFHPGVPLGADRAAGINDYGGKRAT